MQRLFILGNPRSGTSLLRLMVNAHSEITSPPESGFLHWWRIKYNSWSAKESEDLSRVDEFIVDLKSSKKIETWSLNFDLVKKVILERCPADYGQLCECVYVAFAMQKGKIVKAIADKNNYYIHHLSDLLAVWSDAKFLHLVRDGRDVACSYIALQKIETDSPYKPKLPVSLDEIAREWQYNNKMIDVFLQQREPENRLTIRYEDVIVSSEKQLKRICEFMGLEFDKKMLEYYLENRDNQDEPLATLDWKKKTLERPDEKNMDKYKQILTTQEIEQFNQIANEMLTKYSYL